jgi:methylmalonyl-CoA/ethylmalonyl-CoA epimerase
MLPDFQFHHIGIATGSIKNTAQYYLDAGYSISDTIYDPIQNVYIAFLDKIGMPRIELIEPNASIDNKANHPVSKIIDKSGVSPYHICYEVANIDNAINELKKKKFLPLTRPINAVAMDNKKICFLYNKDVGLIELVERIS